MPRRTRRSRSLGSVGALHRVQLMKHYVIYHNVANRGDVAERNANEPFAILTNRPVAGAIGSRVWLISGRGSPTSFQLHYTFTADDAESGEDYGFEHRLRGSDGFLFRPPVLLNTKPWFADLKATQFFSRGLAEITRPDTIEGLLSIAPTFRSLAPNATGDTTYPDEVSSDATYFEGSVVQVLVNRYERDPSAREACLAEYGRVCSVCKCDFAERYGAIGEGFIHVHHITPISQLGSDYQIIPERDLAPVCPNCHAMLHRTNPPLTIQELARLYTKHRRA